MRERERERERERLPDFTNLKTLVEKGPLNRSGTHENFLFYYLKSTAERF
jgi:hypothetical protein